MNYFNDFITPSLKTQVLFKKPTFNELYEMIIDKKTFLISETVFKSSIFENLYNEIKNSDQFIKCFSTEDLKEFFPINSKIFKALCKNKDMNTYQLYFIKTDFKNFDFDKFLKNVVGNKIIDQFKKDNLLELFKSMKNNNALFTYNKNKNNFGIILINENNFSINDIQHEFIHYYEWIKGCYLKHDSKEDNLIFKDLNYFLNVFDLNEDDLDYIFNRNEYQTLLNEFLNILNVVKNKFFNGISEYDFAKIIDKDIFKHDIKFNDTIFKLNKNDSNIEYLNKIKNLKYFNDLFKNESFGPIMIIGYNCLNYKIMNMRNHVYGKFSKKELN